MIRKRYPSPHRHCWWRWVLWESAPRGHAGGADGHRAGIARRGRTMINIPPASPFPRPASGRFRFGVDRVPGRGVEAVGGSSSPASWNESVCNRWQADEGLSPSSASVSSDMYLRHSAHSSFCSSRSAPTRRYDRSLVGKIPTTSVRRLISPLSRSIRIGRIDFAVVLARKTHVGEHVLLGIRHEFSDLRESLLKLIGHHVPLRPSGLLAGLGKDGANERGDHAALAFGRMHQQVAHEMHAAACQAAEITFVSPSGLLWASDDQLLFPSSRCAVRAVEAAQEVIQKRLRFRGPPPSGHALHGSWCVGADDYYSHRDDVPALAHLSRRWRQSTGAALTGRVKKAARARRSRTQS